MLYSTLRVGCDKELTGNPGPTTTEWAHPALHRPGLQPSVNILDHPFRDYLQSNLDSEGVSEWEQGTGIERVGRNVRGINKMLDRLDIVSKGVRTADVCMKTKLDSVSVHGKQNGIFTCTKTKLDWASKYRAYQGKVK
jgi:hypothetical protein